jgi:hypothetical protein
MIIKNKRIKKWLEKSGPEQLLKIFKTGLLVNPTNDPYLLKQLESTKQKKMKPQSSLQFLIQGAKDRPGRLKVGDKYHLQVLILNHLENREASLKNPISIRKMVNFLHKKGFKYKYDYVQINITTPLKKTGLIGSNSDGFFFIRSKEELISSYCFHYHKDLSISHILCKYRGIASKFDIDDFEFEC